MLLSLRKVTKRFGVVTALRGVSLDVDEGSFVCFLGPSGCGKTTLLRIIAGLEPLDSGRVLFRGEDLSEVPARRRNFGVVFQSYSLFPNMTVEANIAYGLQCRKWAREQVATRVREMLALVHLDDQAGKVPHQLSGGQQQRVALARALAPKPSMLLLDEPLSALDAKVREDLRGEVRDLQKTLHITTIMVTHDQDEAMEMADRIVVMNDGGVEQVGSAVDLYESPATRFVGEFIGKMNVLRLEGPMAALATGDAGGPTRGAVIGVRPEDVRIVTGADQATGSVPGRVEKSVYLGNLTRVVIDIDGNKLVAEARGRSNGLTPGTAVSIRVPADAIHYLEEMTR